MPDPVTILLAQELGQGMWHARLLARLGATLTDRDVRCVYALPDPAQAGASLPDDAELLASPVYVPPGAVVPAGVTTRTFADILGAAGWHNRNILHALFRSWQTIVDLVRPDVLVADHAPTPLALTRGALPAAAVGLGFALPPAHLEPLPALTDAPATWDEPTLLAHVDAARRRLDMPPLPRLAAVYDAELTAVTVLPELDPYRAFRDAPAVGPFDAPRSPAPLPPAGAPIFAYLAADDPRSVPLLEALAARGPVRAFVRHASDALRRRLAAAGIAVEATPVALAPALAAAELVVHHGGVGLAQEALLLGRPQLLLPRHVEQRWNAHVLGYHGVGASLEGPVDADALTAALATTRSDAAIRAARNLAVVAGAQVDHDALGRLADAIVGLAAPTRSARPGPRRS